MLGKHHPKVFPKALSRDDIRLQVVKPKSGLASGVYFYDTFTGANYVDILTNHTPDINTLGNSWVKLRGVGYFNIESNQAFIGNGPSTDFGVYTPVLGAYNVSFVKGTGAGTDYFYLSFRSTSDLALRWSLGYDGSQSRLYEESTLRGSLAGVISVGSVVEIKFVSDQATLFIAGVQTALTYSCPHKGAWYSIGSWVASTAGYFDNFKLAVA